MKQLGVDISEHNGSVDFSILQNAGVQFVILRCGFGSDYTNQDDARFKENVQKARHSTPCACSRRKNPCTACGTMWKTHRSPAGI